MNRPVFLGSGSRVARLVGKSWAGTGRIGETPLRIGRAGAPDLVWDMAEPAPPLPPGQHSVMICFAGAVPRGGNDLTLNSALALAAHKAAGRWGLRHVFYLSSSAVYGAPGPDPVSELPDPLPLASYGDAKLAMERALAELPADGPGHTVLRLANVAWAGQPFDAASDRGAASVALHRFGDGAGPSRSYIGPRTLAHVLARLCDLAEAGEPLPPVLNVAAPLPTAMADILTALGRAWHWAPAPPDAIQHVHLDVGRLMRLCPLGANAGDAQTLVDEFPGSVPYK